MPFANSSFRNLIPTDLASLYGFDVSIFDEFPVGSTEPAYNPNLQINK